MAGEMKRAAQAVEKEMKQITTLANQRTRALDKAILDLQKQGVKGVEKVLKTYGEHFTPKEVELLENATDDDIERLIETRKLLKRNRSHTECI